MDVQAVTGVRFGTITAVPSGGRSGQFAVAQDQSLDGTVVSIDHDTVIIAIGNQRVTAQTDAPVQPGDVLRLLVRETGPDQVVMQIVGRGGAPLAMRSLTPQDLSNELTRLGIAPDDESMDVARELLARGQPLTAQNVLEIRTALARLSVSIDGGASANPTDVRAAVFLKAQGLPVTPEAVQIVRQAWASGSALGAHVEELRNALADLAARLVGLTATTAEIAAAPTETQPASSSATAAETAAQGGAPGQSLDTGDAPSSPASRAVVLANWVAPNELTDNAPPATTAPGQATPDSAARQIAPGPRPQATPPSAESAPPAAPSAESAPPAAPSAELAPPAAPSAELAPPTAPSAPLASGTPATSIPTGDAADVVLVLSRAVDLVIDAASGAVPPEPAPARARADGPAASSQAAAESPATTPPKIGPSTPEPSLSRLLGTVSDTLGHLKLLDDRAVAGSRAELADQIRHVIAEHGTPVEAKLARVLEGLVGRAELDRTLVADLRTTLTGLVAETRRHLESAAVAQRLPQEALRDLQTIRGQAEAVLGHVELRQMTNAAAATTPGADSYLMFQLPIPGGPDGQTAEIRIRQDGDGTAKRIDPKNVHVVFQFELQHLGIVRISLRVVDQRVSCHMGSSDAAATALLDQHAEELREGLSGLGYVVDDLRCAVLTPEELRTPDPIAPAGPPPRAMRVDARA